VWLPISIGPYGVEHPLAALAGAGVRLVVAPRR